MSSPRLRITTVLVLATALLALAGGYTILLVLGGALAEAGVEPAAAAAVRNRVLLAAIGVGVVAMIAAAAGGRLLAASLLRLRAAVLQRARGDEAPLPAGGRLREVAELGSAAERLGARASSREEELARGGIEIAALLDNITEGILQLDPQGRVMRANPSARALLGMSGGGIGQNIATHVRHAELRALLQRVAAENVAHTAEVVLGDRRILVSGRPLDPRQQGHGGGAVVAFVDLTEIRRLEGVRRDFVANVSHELKTPLTSIRGYTETLLGDDLPPDMQRQFLEVVHRNADRLHRIVDDLLDLSRLESGGWRPELHEVDAAAIVEDVWSSCSERARQRRIRFQPPTSRAAVLADPSGLRQVLSNLLDNAIRYTPEGGCIEVTVTPAGADAAAAADGGSSAGERRKDEPQATQYVTFEVRDTGIGIPSDSLARVFERFYRVDPARSRAEGGTGLGLSIVKHLVESMGGTVSAHSELGKGTVIRFRLPAAA
jgi:two-component system, OmpR family, phosphate regulon sensor histidine kinase PhoR